MPKCIKCNVESGHAICAPCAEELLDNMNPEELVAHALVGMDAMDGKDKLLERFKTYKALLGHIS
ncbi:hypothetical protein LCGC14_0488430 [marine sediment metagenome]|uniref:Uncharacterized protein n=1 Tax=marine sediment metagenome TaxID=412755 RepID=A0A0F9UU50_9ZZZZ